MPRCPPRHRISGTEEDIEAMELLVQNAESMMESIKQTATAALAASTSNCTGSNIRLIWALKEPSYNRMKIKIPS